MARKSYSRSVFINCPIDDEYTPLFRATVFAVLRCDYHARCAVEEEDSSELRLTKIFRIITECRFGIHDLSRTQMDGRSRLPRFNMPLELGIFLAAKHYGRDEHDKKVCLVFEKRTHSYEKFISDIKGQDIKAHQNSPRSIVIKTRDWLASNSRNKLLQGGDALWMEYRSFSRWLPGKCKREKLKEDKLTFADYYQLVLAWIETKSKPVVDD